MHYEIMLTKKTGWKRMGILGGAVTYMLSAIDSRAEIEAVVAPVSSPPT